MLAANQLQQAQARHAHFYLEQLRAATYQYQRDHKRLRVIEDIRRNWAQIQQGFAWATAEADRNERALTLVSAYPKAGGDLLRSVLSQTERIEWLEKGREAAIRLGQDQEVVDFLVRLGETYLNVSDIDHSRSVYREAIERARTADYHIGQAQALLGLGRATSLIPAEIKDARLYVQQASNLFDQAGNTLGVAQANLILGVIEVRFGDLNEAQALIEGTLSTFRNTSRPRDVARALAQLGSIAERRGAYDEALDSLREAEAIARAIADEEAIINYLARIGLVLDYAGKNDESRICFDEALKLARRSGHRRHMALCLTNLGWLDKDENDIPSAIAHFEEALDINRALGDRNRVAIAITNLAGIYLEQGQSDAARRALGEAMAINLEVQSNEHLLYCLICVAQLALLDGQVVNAIEFLGHISVDPLIDSVEPDVSALAQQVQVRVQQQLSPDKYDVAWAHGAESERDEIVNRALILTRSTEGLLNTKRKTIQAVDNLGTGK